MTFRRRGFKAATELAQAGSGLDRLKMEAASCGATYRDFTNAQATFAFPFTPGRLTATAYLVPQFHAGCPWEIEYLCDVNQFIPFI